MFYLNLKKSKSGHQKMQNPIMLCLKARGIRIAPPGNSYKLYKNKEYIKFSVDTYGWLKKMSDKKRIKEVKKILLIEIMLIGFVLLLLMPIGLAAQGEGSNETLQQELDNLTQYLTSQGYEWLINYSIDYPEIEGYREIDNISGENWYKTYLDGLHGGAGLGESESQETFDLKKERKNE